MAEEVTSIKWHPGFCSAMELEFLQYKDLLDFNREFPLSKEPLRIDLLMIKKIKDIVLEIDIGRLFRTYNIIEYKSPKDGLTIDDYIKTVSYAYLYKGLEQPLTLCRCPSLQLPSSEIQSQRSCLKRFKMKAAA